jgi:hypothetical protein
MNLDQFAAQLCELIGKPSNLRPFVCEGSPLACDVFIVGYNSATKMEGDWWEYWQPDHGFKKHKWKECYLKQRGNKRISPTRNRIEAIVEGVRPSRVLETNIDARPSKRMSEYPQPDTKIFDYLLDVCTPKVVIAHGKRAVAHLQDRKNFTVIESRHFIYVSKARTAEIITQTQSACRDL